MTCCGRTLVLHLADEITAGEEQTYRRNGGRSKIRKGAVVLRLSRPYDAVDHTSLDESLPRGRSGAAPLLLRPHFLTLKQDVTNGKQHNRGRNQTGCMWPC